MRRRPSARDPLYEAPEYVALLGRVAANLRQLREARGWNQDEAAHHCREMAVLVYASLERAENNFTALTLARVAHGFGVDVQTLLAPAEPPPIRKPGRPRKPKPAPDHSTEPQAVPSDLLEPESSAPDD